ncbi:MAG: glycosyltransferase family 39 protein [Anaerolineae bacterium]|nr:glycosyltransferase family 39 protein [Anaerolineae bacterium]
MTTRISTARARSGALAFSLALILLLGWALRTHNLDGRSLWEDEGWTMLLSAGPSLGDVVRTMAADQHPPLYFMIFRVWRTLAGESEFAGRYLGVLIGMIAVAAAFPLGRALFGVRTGVLAALLLVLADLHIDLSQEVRHYSLLATGVVLSSLFYVRWRRRPGRANRLGYVLATLLLLYTHYLGAYIVLIQALHLLLTVRGRRLAEGVFLLAAVGLGFLPWLPVLIDQNSVRWDNPLYYQNALPNSAATFRLVRTALLGHWYAILGGLALLGAVTLSYPRGESAWPRVRLRPAWPALYLALTVVLIASLIVAINERRQFLTVRNFILLVPALTVLAAHGLANLPRLARAFLVTLVVVIALTTVDARRHYPDWRAVVANVSAHHLPGEPVLMDVWVGDFPARYYIDRQLGPQTPRVSLREWRAEYRELFLPRLLDFLQTHDAFWLIYWGDAPLDEYGGLIDSAGFQRTATLWVNHLGTPLYSLRYDKLPPTSAATFGDLFALRRFAAPQTAAPGAAITVALWWTAEQPPSLDYSVSVFLLDTAGALVAQHDGPPLDGRAPTSTWQPGALQFDTHVVHLPRDLPPGAYTLGVKVYWYGDGQPLPAVVGEGEPGPFAALGTLAVGTP